MAKVQLFNIGDTIQVPEFGAATVLEVHGRGWVKVDGVPKAWHKIADIIELNPAAKEAYDEAVKQAELAKEMKKSGVAGKIAKIQARVDKMQARVDEQVTKIDELKAQITALQNGEVPAGEAAEGEGEGE